jgi:hypothetical protein
MHNGNNQADRPRRGTLVKLGLRSILLLVAVILFVVAIFADKNAVKWLAAGLAVFAGAFLLGEMGGRLRRRM